MPRVLREGVTVGENVVLAHSNDFAKDGSLATPFSANDQRLTVCYCFNVGLMILKCLFQEIVAIGVGATKVRHVNECSHMRFPMSNVTQGYKGQTTI